MDQIHFSAKQMKLCIVSLHCQEQYCHSCFKVWMGEENVLFHLALVLLFRSRFYGDLASVIDRIEVLCVNNPQPLIILIYFLFWCHFNLRQLECTWSVFSAQALPVLAGSALGWAGFALSHYLHALSLRVSSIIRGKTVCFYDLPQLLMLLERAEWAWWQSRD